MALTFEWDSNKAAQNIANGEQRFVTLGVSFRQRLVVVAHTDLEERIRIISARRATGAERQYNEEEGS